MITTSDLKLIIWDLDNTFWQGTLSEGEVKPIRRNIELVRLATDLGIVNSICSKNDLDAVRAQLCLERFSNLWDCFVFPSVDWTPKGERIRQILEDMSLRPENTLFIDDEVFNLQEAKHLIPKLQIARPEVLQELYQQFEKRERTDLAHRRLAQYHLLEKKRAGQKAASSNEEFLRVSDIRIICRTNCKAYADRIHELLNRTNQLNYTKERPSREEVDKLLDDDKYECAVIHLSDRYGDYGEIGFYAMEHHGEHRLRHFAFSCRVLGTGVEQYVYQKLGFPPLTIVGEIAVPLKKEAVVDWIREEAEPEIQEDGSGDKQAADPGTIERVQTSNGKILLKGPCDIDGMLPYFTDLNEFELEAPFVDERGIVVGSSCSLHLYEAWHYPLEEIRKTIARTPFLSEADFVTYMFEENYRTVVFSTLSDGHAGVYRDRENGLRICFSSRNFDLTDPLNWQKFISGEYANANVPFDEDSLRLFADRFVFEGALDSALIVRNLRWIREKLNEKTMLILLLGSEIEAPDNTLEFSGHASVYRALNEQIRYAFGESENVKLVDATEYIAGADSFVGCTNHYSRAVYQKMAERIEVLING